MSKPLAAQIEGCKGAISRGKARLETAQQALALCQQAVSEAEDILSVKQRELADLEAQFMQQSSADAKAAMATSLSSQTDSSSLDKTCEAELQGQHRLARGLFFWLSHHIAIYNNLYYFIADVRNFN